MVQYRKSKKVGPFRFTLRKGVRQRVLATGWFGSA
jgi:hypothetical protein